MRLGHVYVKVSHSLQGTNLIDISLGSPRNATFQGLTRGLSSGLVPENWVSIQLRPFLFSMQISDKDGLSNPLCGGSEVSEILFTTTASKCCFKASVRE